MEEKPFSNRLRVRACAVISSAGNLLLLKHNSPTRKEPVWMPPGGEVLLGENIEAALVREVAEETGLRVDPDRLLCVHEFIEMPYHAIEFYYECSITGGMLKLGEDPELHGQEQILLDLKFISPKEAEELAVYPRFLYNYFRGEPLERDRNITYISGSEPE